MFKPAKPQPTGVGDTSDGPIQHISGFWGDRRWPFPKARANFSHPAEKPIQPTDYTHQNDDHVGNHTVAERSVRLLVLRHALVHLAFLLPIVAFALVLSIPKLYDFRTDYWAESFSHCNYDGSFTPYDNPSKSLWDRSGFFYINVAWGKMDFSTAKFIDIVWDVGVGRAGQAVIAYVTFKVTSQYLAMAMHEGPVSYATFESLAFVPPTLGRTGRLAGDLLTNRGWRTRLIMVWIVLSSLFVIGFSSFATAMSGYGSDTTAVMPDYDGSDAAWADYEVVQFAINDAWRIGEPGPVTITGATGCVQQGLRSDDDGGNDDGGAPNTYHRRDGSDDVDGDDPWEYVPFNCTLFWRTVQYVSVYGLQAASEESSTFILDGVTHNLTSPTLNITTSYTPSSLSLLLSYLAHFSTEPAHILDHVDDVSSSTFWIYDNQTYSYEYVMDHATCRYTRWHNWGFSYLLLFITTLFLAIWAIGTYSLWLYVYLHGPRDERNRYGEGIVTPSSGIYRSSWTLVEAMKRDLGPEVVAVGMTEQEIRNLVRRRRGNGPNGVRGVCARENVPVSTMEAEKGAHSCLQPPARQSTRWEEFRAWLRPSRPSSAMYNDGMHIHTRPTLFQTTSSTFSASSQRPFLTPRSPSTSHTLSPSHVSPSPSSIFTFNNQPITPTDVLAGTTAADAGGVAVSGRKPRPGLSRLVSTTPSHSSTSNEVPISVLTSSTPWWVPMSSASTASVSILGSAVPSHVDTTSPVTDRAASLESRSVEAGTTRPNDGIQFKNDLGDD